MPKYRVYGVVTGSKFLGVYEAASEEEAVEQALEGDKNYTSLCHQCADEIELDDYSCSRGYAEEEE